MARLSSRHPRALPSWSLSGISYQEKAQTPQRMLERLHVLVGLGMPHWHSRRAREGGRGDAGLGVSAEIAAPQLKLLTWLEQYSKQRRNCKKHLYRLVTRQPHKRKRCPRTSEEFICRKIYKFLKRNVKCRYCKQSLFYRVLFLQIQMFRFKFNLVLELPQPWNCNNFRDF